MEDLALQLQQRNAEAGNEQAEMRLLKKETTLKVRFSPADVLSKHVHSLEKHSHSAVCYLLFCFHESKTASSFHGCLLLLA